MLIQYLAAILYAWLVTGDYLLMITQKCAQLLVRSI